MIRLTISCDSCNATKEHKIKYIIEGRRIGIVGDFKDFPKDWVMWDKQMICPQCQKKKMILTP
jgi:hypothetical protein